MPRAYDRGQLSISHNPAQRIDMALPKTPHIEPFDLFAGCGDFVEGIKTFGLNFLQATLADLIKQLDAAVKEPASEENTKLVRDLKTDITATRAKLSSPTQLTLLGAGVQALGDAIWGLVTCGGLADPLIAAVGKAVSDIGEALSPGAILAKLLKIFGALGSLVHPAWDNFLAGWHTLNWLPNPFAAIHPAWMLVVDLGWDLMASFGDLLNDVFGINLPGFFALTELRGHWSAFFTAWSAINWGNPFDAIHRAWMALVDLFWDLWAWAQTVLHNLTGISIPDFLEFGILRDLWAEFTTSWAAIQWNSLAAIFSALRSLGGLVRGLTALRT